MLPEFESDPAFSRTALPAPDIRPRLSMAMLPLWFHTPRPDALLAVMVPKLVSVPPPAEYTPA